MVPSDSTLQCDIQSSSYNHGEQSQANTIRADIPRTYMIHKRQKNSKWYNSSTSINSFIEEFKNQMIDDKNRPRKSL